MRNGRPVTDTWKVGIINVMTLTGKSEELIDFMEREGLEMLGLSEVKWKGREKLLSSSKDFHLKLYQGI